MTTIAATFSRQMKQAAGGISYAKPGLIKRFRRFIEYSGWDEKLTAHAKSVNKICLGVIIASALYFTPIVINIFLR